ncbi:Predicted exporter [Methylomagnum ishizawai]|uniref:Predicted exporter n=1 Tax=Methylomagnum ishizawai TaxID=1760988 RepID=A0A1Y6CRP5_9GAMM|nr:MMPL family transporter [Methylomagnum ishizawai]SMF93299.1 Predicted exporter [Methylomagnum ishizawai]
MRAKAPLLLWLLWLALCAWWLLFRTAITTDLTFFLPRDAGFLDAVLVQQMREGPASRVLMIALENADEAALAATSRQLAANLASDPRFERVDNGAVGAGLATLEQHLFAHRYGLDPEPGPEPFTAAALHTALQARLAELASPTGMLQKAWLTRDPTGAWQRLLQGWLVERGPVARRGVWFAREGRRALLLARTRASGFDIAAQAEALERVRERFQTLRTDPAMRLVLGGPGPLSVESNRRITHDAAWLSGLNSGLVMLLLFGVYRSLRVLGLGLVPLLTGVVSGAAATRWAFGEVHGITLGFGATLVGVAADYPNHFFTHLSPREPPARAMARIWPTLRLGLLTNVAGFAAMLFSGFAGLAQLAVFAGGGLLAAGLATRWVLPVLAGDGTVRLPAWVERGAGFSWPGFPRWRWLPFGLTLLLAALFMLGGSPLWNDDIAALNPVPAERQALDEALRRDFGVPDLRKLVLATGPDAEAALRLSEAVAVDLEALKRDHALGGYELAARFLPSRAAQARRLAALPPGPELAANLREALRGLPFKPEAFQPFLDGVEAARRQAPLSRADLADTPFAAQVDSLLLPLQDRWVALIPLSGIADPAAIAARLAPWRERGVYDLDLREESTRIVRDYRREAIALLAGSLAAIVLLLGLGLRSLPLAVRVLAPVLTAGLCTGLAMAVLFHGLTLYHLVSLLLVMGLSLDQALFFNRDAADPEERRRTLLSLLVCGLSSVLAFGTLALSDINILRSIGSTVALGALLAIAFAAWLAQPRPVPR